MSMIKIKDEYYELPVSELYIHNFENTLDNDCIVLDNFPLEKKYEYLKKLLRFICNTITALNDDTSMPYAEEISDACRKMSSVDNLQNFLHQNGKTDNAIKLIEEFTEELLKLYSKLMDDSHISM